MRKPKKTHLEFNPKMYEKPREVIHAPDGTTHIPVGKSQWAIIDTEDFPLVKEYKWSLTKTGYAQNFKTKTWMHRLVNKTPEGYETDHINGNPLDNRRENLRSATRQENKWNSRERECKPYNESAYCRVSEGIRAAGATYQAFITHNGKSLYLGSFSNVYDAKKFRDGVKETLRGEYARIHPT
jgi:hypothetical protein